MLDDLLQLSRVQPFAFAIGTNINLNVFVFDRAE
jgi:hypothetical protein